jgi:hypothetical protein
MQFVESSLIVELTWGDRITISQEFINEIMEREFKIPIEVDKRGVLPQLNHNYNKLRDAENFTVRAKTLLHAIGSKTAALPRNEEDECINSARLYLNILDWEQGHLAFKKGLDSDLQTPRSMEIGIGMMCLIASEYFNVG